jgi:poly(beta-D-mannuronate) lyase
MVIVSNRVSSLLICLLGLFFFENSNAKEYQIASADELNALSLVAGDVVIMTNGTWTDQNLTFKGTGTQDQPITLRAETPGNVVLTGESRLSLSGEYLIVEGLAFIDGALEGDDVIQFRTSDSSLANHCRLTNTAIQNYNPWDSAEEYKWVSLYGEYNQVDNCSFVGKNHQGALLVVWIGDSANHHIINNNYFADIPELGQNGGETIRIGTSTNSMKDSYTLVENNLFENCDGEIEIISNKSCENIYRYNTFLNCEGTLALRHGNRCSIYGNFFFGDVNKNCGGVRIIGEDHKVYNNYFQDIIGGEFRSAISINNGVPDSPLSRYFQVKNAEVVNNTIVNCKYPLSFGAGKSDELSLPPLNTTIANNVIADYNGITSQAISYIDTPLEVQYVQNIVYSASLGDTPDEVNNDDPKLTFSANFYRPENNSPVISFGDASFSYVDSDIDGQSRADSNDAGCDQVSEEEFLHAPFTINDIGVLIGASFDLSDNYQGYDDGEESLFDSVSYKLEIIDAVASTEQNEDGKMNIALNSIDGDYATRWSGEGIGEYIDLFLDQQYTLSFIKIGHYKGDERASSFHLLAWNSTSLDFDTLLNNVTSVISDGDIVVYDFDNVDSDKVRLVGLGYSDGTGTWNSYTEFELWGQQISSVLGVDAAPRELDIAVYPNPSSAGFKIKNCIDGYLNIFSLSGVHLYSQSNVNSNSYIYTQLERGVYILKVDSMDGTFVDRLILI